jgi:hypothetical protein
LFLVLFLNFGSCTVFTTFFPISNFFSPITTEETYVVKIRIWCIKIGNVLILHQIKTKHSITTNSEPHPYLSNLNKFNLLGAIDGNKSVRQKGDYNHP